jgi:hypothetical protein
MLNTKTKIKREDLDDWIARLKTGNECLEEREVHKLCRKAVEVLCEESNV